MSLPANLGFSPEYFMQCTACPSIMFKSAEYIMTFQLFSRAAIAVNRFTCFGTDSTHNRLWTGRGLRVIMVGLVIAPFLLTSYQLPFGGHYTIVNGSIVGSRRDNEVVHEVRFVYFASSKFSSTRIDMSSDHRGLQLCVVHSDDMRRVRAQRCCC